MRPRIFFTRDLNKFLFSLVAITLTLAPLTLCAVDVQSIVPPGTDALPADEVFTLILKAIGGLSGAGTMAIVLVVVQVAYALMRSRLGEKTGLWRLTILSGLALVLGFVGLLANGVPLSSALFHASMLPLIQNFIAQVVIQLGNHPEEKAAAAALPSPVAAAVPPEKKAA